MRGPSALTRRYFAGETLVDRALHHNVIIINKMHGRSKAGTG
jgi:hypothetical protein